MVTSKLARARPAQSWIAARMRMSSGTEAMGHLLRSRRAAAPKCPARSEPIHRGRSAVSSFFPKTSRQARATVREIDHDPRHSHGRRHPEHGQLRHCLCRQRRWHTSHNLLQPTSRCGRETANAERPCRRDGPGWGTCLRHPIEARHVASRIIPWR